MSVKYAILHRIGAVNWVPTNHTSTIATDLARFVYAVGTMAKFYVGNYIFEQTLKHAGTCAVKMPIAFPSLLCGIILSQHPSILTSTNSICKRESSLFFHPKLFEGSHISDMVRTSSKVSTNSSKVDLIAELKDTCKTIDDNIRTWTEKKVRLELLIKSLSKERMNEDVNTGDGGEDEGDDSDGDEEDGSDSDDSTNV